MDSNSIAEKAAQAAADQATKTFLQRISDGYHQFVSAFPEQYQWIVSLLVLLAVASLLFNLIRKNILWLVLLAVLFPGILPVIKNFVDSLTALLTGKPIG